MRIAFVGKGGSGKTTLSALFTRRLIQLARPVLAIDADVNQHLGQALGLSDEELSAVPALGADIPWIKDHLRGKNPRIPSADVMIKTSPPGRGSRLLALAETEPLHRRFARPIVPDAGLAHLMVAGEFGDDDIGVSCYHSKTGAVEMYLNHLLDTNGEYVVVDMTAGADAFASGLFTRFDLVVLVCEPTRRGIAVYEQFRQHIESHEVRLRVLGNKAAGPADADWLREQLGSAMLGCVGHSEWVRAAEQGHQRPFDELEPDIVRVVDGLVGELDGLRRDWDAYHRDTVRFHLRNAQAWGNSAAGVDLAEQIDPEFRPDLAAAPVG